MFCNVTVNIDITLIISIIIIVTICNNIVTAFVAFENSFWTKKI